MAFMTAQPEPPPATRPDLAVHLAVTTTRVEGAVVLGVAGTVDQASVAQLRAATLRALAERPARAVLDLREVDGFDAVGLGVLVEAVRAAPPGTQVRVVARRTVLRSVRLAGLAGVLDTYPTWAEALAYPTAGEDRATTHHC